MTSTEHAGRTPIPVKTLATKNVCHRIRMNRLLLSLSRLTTSACTTLAEDGELRSLFDLTRPFFHFGSQKSAAKAARMSKAARR
jgi:hypothetical protein